MDQKYSCKDLFWGYFEKIRTQYCISGSDLLINTTQFVNEEGNTNMQGTLAASNLGEHLTRSPTGGRALEPPPP